MSKALIVLPLFIFNSFFGSAQNIICNPGFETHDPVKSFPNLRAQAGDRLECWEDDISLSGGFHFHSPDWYHFNGNQSPFVLAEDIDGTGTFVNILGRNNSDGYLGMGTCELIKQNTWNPGFLNNNGYVISFYVRRPRPTVQVGGVNYPMTSETVYIEVSISKNGPTYPNQCTS